MKLSFITISLLLMSFKVFSGDEIGRVTKLRGNVYRSNSANKVESQKLQEGSRIHVGDSLNSDAASFAKVLMKDDTVFSIGSKTEFVFEKFKMSKASDNDRDATYYLISGKLRSLFTRKAPRRSLKIRTPIASMGVRGTEIVSDVYKYNGKIRANIGLLTGSLEVYSQGKMVKLLPQDMLEVSRGVSEGRSPANSFKKRKMKMDVFKRLNSSPIKGEQPFLFDVLKKNRKSLSKRATFSYKSVEKKSSGRMPASVELTKEEKRKKARLTKGRTDVVKDAAKDYGTARELIKKKPNKLRRHDRPHLRPKEQIENPLGRKKETTINSDKAIGQ